MRWLHGFLYDLKQVLAQLAQVHLAAEGGTEGFQGPGRVIFTTVEAMVDGGLDAMAQGLEEGSNDQGGDDDGDTAVLADDAPQERLQANDQANIDRRQDDRECAIDQGAVDDDVDIVEPVAQQGDPDGEGEKDRQDRCNRCDEVMELG